MYKMKNESLAKQIAEEKTLSYGHCIFDGFFYVGKIEQLNKIGVIII